MQVLIVVFSHIFGKIVDRTDDVFEALSQRLAARLGDEHDAHFQPIRQRDRFVEDRHTVLNMPLKRHHTLLKTFRHILCYSSMRSPNLH